MANPFVVTGGSIPKGGGDSSRGDSRRDSAGRNAREGNNPFLEALKRGSALAWKGRWEQAIEEYRVALKQSPRDAAARTYLAMALYKSGQLQEAVELYRGLCDEQPSNLALLQRLAEVEETMGDLEAAVDIHRRLAEVHGRRRAGEEALNAWKKAVALKPDDIALWNSLMDAATQLDAVSSLIPSYLDLARRLALDGRFQEAVQVVEKAQSLDPGNPLMLPLLAAIRGALAYSWRAAARGGTPTSEELALLIPEISALSGSPSGSSPASTLSGEAPPQQESPSPGLAGTEEGLVVLPETAELVAASTETAQPLSEEPLPEPVTEVDMPKLAPEPEAEQPLSISGNTQDTTDEEADLSPQPAQADEAYLLEIHAPGSPEGDALSPSISRPPDDAESVHFLKEGIQEEETPCQEEAGRLEEEALPQVVEGKAEEVPFAEAGTEDEALPQEAEAREEEGPTLQAEETGEETQPQEKSLRTEQQGLDGEAVSSGTAVVEQLMEPAEAFDRSGQGEETAESGTADAAEMLGRCGSGHRVELASLPPGIREEVVPALKMGEELLREGLFRSAADELYRLIGSHPDFLPAHSLLGQVLAGQQRVEVAADSSRRLLELYELRGVPEQALEVLEWRVAGGIDDGDDHARLLQLLREQDRLAEAEPIEGW